MAELVLVRCYSCRGMKKVAKLGGIVGDCNTCKGKGEIKDCDIPKPKPVEVIENVTELLEAVAEVQPVESIEPEDKPVEPLQVTKRAIYKRKKG